MPCTSSSQSTMPLSLRGYAQRKYRTKLSNFMLPTFQSWIIAKAARLSPCFSFRNNPLAALMSLSVPLSAATFSATVVGWAGPQMKLSAFASRPIAALSIAVSSIAMSFRLCAKALDVGNWPARSRVVRRNLFQCVGDFENEPVGSIGTNNLDSEWQPLFVYAARDHG